MSAPRVERLDDLVLLSGFAATDAIVRSPDGATCAVVVHGPPNADARPSGAWIVDLDEARVVTFVAAPEGLRFGVLMDAETLCALGGDGVLRTHALPDGGVEASVAVPGARWISGASDRRIVLQGDTRLEVAPGGGRLLSCSAEPCAWRIDPRAATVEALLHERTLAAMLAGFDDEMRRYDGGEQLLPWLVPSPDGDEVALVCSVSDRPARDWRAGDLDEDGWTHPFTFRWGDPSGTLQRWAAPIEAWGLGWWDRDTLSGLVGVATGPPPYRLMPFVQRRILRDGAVVTWRAPDSELLERPRASARERELDDGRFCVVVHGPRFALARAHDPATGFDATRDLLADVAPATLHPDRPVLAEADAAGAFVLALPLASGETVVTVDGRPRTVIPAEIGPPDRLQAGRAWIELTWHGADISRWRRGFVRRRP